MTPVIRAYDATIDSVDKGERSMVARINTAGLDRYKTVIDPKGAKLENYRRNPVVLWEHGKDPRRFTDPIGRNVWVRSNGGERPKELLAKTRFLEDDFSQQRYEWYRDGVLSAFSVNILPDDTGSSPPTKDEMRARPELADCAMMYRSWELAEYSGTTVPGNADCLTGERAAKMLAAVGRGLWLPDDVAALVRSAAAEHAEPDVEPDDDEDDPQPAMQAKRYIRKKGEKWVVYSEAGKALGEHDSEEGAKKQLAAIEAHKHDEAGRSAPWIDESGGVFIVRSPEGAAILSTADRSVAEQCLAVMGHTRSFEAAHHQVIHEVRTAFTEFKEDIIATLDLMVHGRV